MSLSSSAQKDYSPLSNCHAHLNAKKSSTSGNMSITNDTNNGNVNSENNSIDNSSNSVKSSSKYLTIMGTTEENLERQSNDESVMLNSNHYRMQHQHQQERIHQQHNNNNTNKSASPSGNDSVISVNSTTNINTRKSFTGTDPSNASFSSASVTGSVQDDNMSDDQCSLTQAGLEEYNSRSYYDQPVFHHQKQSSYAQSEGYHSYVSSSDSSSATPFLDRLRQESELLSRQSHHWSQNDLSSSLNNVSSTADNNNSSESTSSTETLKWLGSMSDVSVASHASSAISGSVSSSQLIVHSSKVRTPKRHNSESVLYMNDDQISVANDITAVNNSGSGGKIQQIYPHHPHYHQSPSTMKGLLDHHHSNSTVTSTSRSGSPTGSPATMMTTTTTSSATSSSSYRNNHRLFPVSTYTEPVNGGTGYHQSPQLHHHHHQYQQQQSAQPQTQQQQHSASSPSSSVVSSSSSSVANQQLPGIKLSSPQSNNWQSVADRINDFERQQQHLYHYHALQNQQNNSTQKYTYIDPSKTHRVPNPTLKAFQKNAVQSYFERQQQNAKENSRNYSSNNGNIVRPQSLQPQGAPKEVPTPQIRTSLPNNYVMSLSSQRCSKSQQMSLNNMLQSPLVNSDGSFSEFGVPPPPPPPRSRSLMPIRRSSSASDYADFRENFARAKERQNIKRELPVQSITNPEKSSFNNCGMPPPPPPPRGRTSMPVRRTSSASDYAGIREKNIKAKQSLSSDLLGPIIMGPIISVDDWVPERPPKNPHLRIPSPDLPPPPLQATDTDVNLTDQDEPLPPPPPEILRYVRTVTETDNKSSSPNRRNSFAGSPSRKSFYRATTFENLSPPSIPKKPPAIEILHCRPASSLAQSNKAHKVILNGKLEGPNCSSVNGHINGSIQDQLIIPRGCDSRMSVRKRAHNSHALMTPSPDPNRSTSNKNCLQNVKSPPPLKPRMPIAGQEMRATSVAINSKLRCNSKASYLPRQSRDKLNSTDPDHGSYKLTLTSNEDSISQNTTTAYHDDILSTKCNNLPDVLPVGAKVQSSSPSSSSNSSPRYGSNNNINNSTPPHTAPPIISNYPMKSLFHFQNSINNNSNTNNSPRSNASPTANSPPAYNSPHRLSPFISSEQISPKFMSQSTIDLKKTHVIESTEITPLSKMLSPAQSENNISSHEKPPLSPFSARREKQRTEIVRKLSLEEKDSGEGRIVRAELVNTILSSSPTRSEEKIMIRKDSFRENIEKITQLQSKLMTAHLVDNGGEKKLLGYTGRTVELKAHQQVFETETSKSHESLSTKSSSSTKVLFNPSEPPTSPPPPTPTSPPPNNIEPLSQMDTEIDGLKLMQRTEIILRLNAPTMEAASQTDETHELEISRVRLIDSRDDVSKSSERLATSALEPRKRLPEEIDCDILSKELADCLPITDKLCQVLAPKIYKVASDYVGGLYNPHVSVKLSKKDISTSTLNDKSVGCELIKAPNVELHGTASSTAERLDREVRNVVLTNGSDSCDLNKKKEELINRLTKAVEVLISEQTSVSEKSATNELLGSDLAAKIAEKVRPIEASKFRAYIDDVGHITMLLLSLSGRLAKLENVLHSGSENHPEKKIFEVKRDRLLEQLEEAKRLKEDIDRRGTIVSKMLEKHLTTEEYVDYEYFINMKAKLIVDSREITERIKLNEEQLTALKSTLVQADC